MRLIEKKAQAVTFNFDSNFSYKKSDRFESL